MTQYISLAQAKEAVDRASAATLEWKATPLTKRIEIVTAFLVHFKAAHKEISTDLSKSMGRPLSQNINEINGVVERTEYLLSIAEATLAPLSLPEKHGFKR
jgi:acyl-CoA reductase-like NAD-dependent aldehyde dehydrogenase